MTPSLFDPITVGKLSLPNRIAMAPLARNRSGSDGVLSDMAVTYYSQRAGVGLIVSEGTQPSDVGQGYFNSPGVYRPDHLVAWRAVCDAIHGSGGRLFVQLMHAGRIGHTDNKHTPDIVAPSALVAPGEILTPAGMRGFPVPRALSTEEIPGVIAEFVHAARTAVDAGADGVEIHAANGYLVHQFLGASANCRTDSYGGSPVNRARFAVETVAALAEAIGPERVAIRISPANNIQGVIEDDPADLAATYGALVDAIAPHGIAYLSYLADPRTGLIADLRARFGGPVMGNEGDATMTTFESAQALLDENLADLVAVGRLAIANPDLVRRWREGAPLNEPDPATFYDGGATGYIDYPCLGA